MRSFIRHALLFQSLILASAGVPEASTKVTTDQFAVMAQYAQALCARYGCENVVAGYDIDNTLLDPPSELGSDEWFTWQASLLPEPGQTPSKHSIAPNIQELLSKWGLLIDSMHDHPVDPQAPSIVGQLQNMGIPSIVVTARGDEFRGATLRELQTSGYAFSRKPLLDAAGFPSPYLPYDPAHPELAGLSGDDLTKFKLSQQPLPVSYSSGVFMVAGQHKGAMLRTLLAKSGAHPKAILYIDDTPVQVQRMQAAFEGSGIDVITIQYSKTYPRVVEFFESDKSEVTQAWQDFERAPRRR